MNLKELSLYLQDYVQTTLQHTRLQMDKQRVRTIERRVRTTDAGRPAGSLEKAVKVRVHDTSCTRPRVAGGRVERRGPNEAVKGTPLVTSRLSRQRYPAQPLSRTWNITRKYL